MNNDWVAMASTAFSGHKIHVQTMTGHEELGRPFRYELVLLCAENDLNLNRQLGQPLTIDIETSDARRYFNGIVSEMSFAGMAGHKSRYTAVVRPSIWFLVHRSDNRVFQEQTVPDILAEVFDEAGVSYKKSLTATYRNREYCVQYGETDFEFVSRLMEEEGIYYFFEHSDGKHEMVIADSPSAHVMVSGYEEISFFPASEGQRDEDHINDWKMQHQVKTQKFAVSSHNFEKSKAPLLAESAIKQKHGQAGKEQYEYGSLYPEKADGTQLSKTRVEEQQSGYAIAFGEGNVRGVSCGNKFKLAGYPRDDQNAEYLVVSATYYLKNSDIETGRDDGDVSFTCRFSAIEEKISFRPARNTTRAVVRGPQTAVVVGPKGEEIWTDKYGRVKIQFHWDRDGMENEKSSCFVRVSHALAGQNWGMVSIPRIGQEVVVSFLEGDPDQPIITGAVYNDVNMPPYKLPDNQTQSGFKSRSSKNGSADNFNELRFEDKLNDEEIFFQAERNFNRVVRNNDSLEVGLDYQDPGDQTIVIHNDRTTTLNAGSDLLQIETGNRTLNVNDGNQTTYVKNNISIEAGEELEITVGQSKLKMTQSGDITLEGVNIEITAMSSVKIEGKASVEAKGAQIKIEGTAKADVKAPMTKVEGSAMLDLNAGGMAKLKGGITMIG